MTSGMQAAPRATETILGAAMDNGRGRAWPLYALFALGALGLHLTVAASALPDPGVTLIDPDSYMRLVRVQALLDGQSWWDGTIARSNAPYGEAMHWTRPLDVLLILLMLPFRLALSQPASLHWAGVVVSPLLHLATCIAGAWAARPLAGRHALWVMPALLAPAPIFAYAVAGRADHHLLILLVVVLALGATLRAMAEANERRAAAIAGALTGFGLWLSIEFLAPGALLGLGLLGAWLLADERQTPARGEQLQAFAATCLSVLVVALASERLPQEWFVVEYDRISIVHLSAAALGTQAAGLLARLRPPGSSIAVKLAALGSLGALALIGLRLAFPAILGGPMAEVDPRVEALIVARIIEMRSLWPHTLAAAGDTLEHLGGLLVALPAAAFLARRAVGSPNFLGWAFLGCATAAAGALALLHFRSASLAAAFAALPLAVALGGGFDYFRGRLPSPWGAGAAALFVTGVLVLPPILGNLPGVFAPRAAAGAPSVVDCAHEPLAAALAGVTPPQIILANSFGLGPPLLYRSRHSVVAGPYHRNTRGIVESGAFWGSTADDTRARAVIKERGIGLVLVCHAVARNFWPAEDGGGETLHARLLDGKAPSWLKPIKLPPAAAAFALYAAQPAGN